VIIGFARAASTAHKTLSAGAGAYGLTGAAASVRPSASVKTLAAAAGSYGLTGTVASVRPSASVKTLAAAAGSYGLTGTVANLLLPFTPAQLSGLVGWWDASISASINKTGSNINSIADQSGGGHTMSWTGFGQPTYSATGFNTTFPAFRVDAVHVGSALQATSYPMGTGNTLTFWYVGKNDAANSNTSGRAISYMGPGETDDYNNAHSWAININKGISNNTMTITRNTGVVGSTNTTVSNAANHRVIGTINSSGVQTIYVDGVSATLSTASGNWTNAGILAIGRDAADGNYFACDFAEVGVATGFHSSTTIGQLDTYLKTKWGL
jgi:hypothetical protein